MAIQTAAGATLGVVAAAPGTYDATGYQALTHVTVGEISNIGEFLREYQLVTFNDLGSRATRKLKGSYNNGTLNPTLAIDPADAGQVVLETAVTSDSPIACVVTLQDGTEYHFMGLVMSFRPNVGGTDDVVTATCTIEVGHEDGAKVAAP